MARKAIYPPSVQPGIPRLGKLPKGWSSRSFGELLHTELRAAKVDPDEVYQLVVARRSRGGIAPRERLKGKKIKTKTQFYTKAGDFLISRRQIIHGACGVVPESLDGALVSNEYSTLVPADGCDLKFLEYFSHTIYFQQTTFHASVGVDVEKMIFRLEDWLGTAVHVPPLAEQRRIAEILSAWDSAIEQTEKLLAAKETRKRALMQQLLTGKRRFGGKAHHPATKRLREGIKLISGQHVLAEKVLKQGRGIPYLTGPSNFPNGRIKTTSFVSEATAVCSRGDILVTVKGSGTGTLTRSDGAYAISRQLMAIQALEWDGDYLYHFLQTFVDTFARAAAGLIPGISRPEILNAVAPFPPLAEQKKIAEVLNTADAELVKLQDHLAALRRQKQGLMQVLLTGRVRTMGKDEG